jgi:hypothetical protein
MTIFIAIFMFLTPGLISIRIKWHKKKASKSDFKHILSDYLFFSFSIMVLVFAFIFLADAVRGHRFGDRVFALSQGVSAGFILNYSAVAIIAAVVLPLWTKILLLIRMLYKKTKSGVISVAERINVKVKKHPRNIVVAVVVLLLLATSIIVPLTYTASHVPQILVITPDEVYQARGVLDSQGNEEDIEITIAGMYLSPTTVIYVNNMRVNDVQEITGPDEVDDEIDENFEHELEFENESECIFDTVLYGFENGLSFYLPPMHLKEAGIIEIVAVNNADAIIPARSNPVFLHVLEAEYPEIFNVTATHLTDDMRVHLHIYGQNFAPHATVSISGTEQTATVVLDEQNIYVMLDTSTLPLKIPEAAEDNTDYTYEDESPGTSGVLTEQTASDEVTVVVRNSEGIQSEAYILSGITGIDTTTDITHTDDWLRGSNGIIASGLGGWEGLTNTNSKEAFMYNYGQGFRLFEFQTQFSSDGVLFGICGSNRVPGLTFKQEQERVPYTIMSFEDIIALMVTYDNWHLIIDPQYHNNMYAIENTFRYVISTINSINTDLIDRIIIQVHDQHTYHYLTSNFPFTAYIYHLPYSHYLHAAELEFIRKSGIPALRIPLYHAKPEIIETLTETGTSVFVSSEDDILQTYELFETDITGIFTNFFTPAMRHMAEEELHSIEEKFLLSQNHRRFISFVNKLPIELGDNYIRFISTGFMNYSDMPEAVMDAISILTDLSFTPIDEYIVNGHLVIDDFQYRYEINSRAITYIVYDKNNGQILEWVAFDPLTTFERIDFHRENNRKYMLEYLENLLHENLIVLMSVRDEASYGLDTSVLESLSELGLRQSLADRWANSYVAIIDGRTVIYEEISNNRISHVLLVDRWLVELLSGGLQAGHISRIIVDGVDHSRNHRGINIVVLNKQTGLIEDSVAFDTHDNLSAHRGED